jgi:hypothetical protein
MRSGEKAARGSARATLFEQTAADRPFLLHCTFHLTGPKSVHCLFGIVEAHVWTWG